ncbi:hypothetical protein, conserved [Babesia ovata]|uniref:Uncharacterized protein n=1 Tax=Babesia ovata TaxID=189622 RepID=A0A2H6KE08_9APIC|nr:uncharacterized protein BOVATA_027070 [Babesia ovata]GBE61214.1 hypothetical protein, conserved [Babesia ovata]
MLCERMVFNPYMHVKAFEHCKGTASQLLSVSLTNHESLALTESVLDRPSSRDHLSQALIEVLKQSFDAL